jgi:hypothetical protein
LSAIAYFNSAREFIRAAGSLRRSGGRGPGRSVAGALVRKRGGWGRGVAGGLAPGRGGWSDRMHGGQPRCGARAGGLAVSTTVGLTVKYGGVIAYFLSLCYFGSAGHDRSGDEWLAAAHRMGVSSSRRAGPTRAMVMPGGHISAILSNRANVRGSFHDLEGFWRAERPEFFMIMDSHAPAATTPAPSLRSRPTAPKPGHHGSFS